MDIENLTGLTDKQIAEKQKEYGLNEFVKNEKRSLLKKFLFIFKEPMFLLLIFTAMLYLILGQFKEACVMLVFVIFVTSITMVQESKTEKTIDALKDLTSPEVIVIRNGKEITIKSTNLVPGDIVLLKEGERIPADCKILDSSNFLVDESVLTGESEYKEKSSYKITNEEEDNYFKNNRLYAGTLSIFGTCMAEVEKIGFYTEYGKISKAINETKEEATPLQRKTQKLVKNLAVVGLVFCISVIILSYFYNHDIIASILSGITLAMAIIPEEFPVVLTVFLSLGALRLAKENTLMRKISAVETLGAASILAVDKTGTITKNDMEVTKVFIDNEIKDIKCFDNTKYCDLMILSCEKQTYDPMEKALVKVAEKNSSTIEDLENKELAQQIAFNSKTKRMANIYKVNNEYYIAAKGSPESIIELCNISEEENNYISTIIDKMAEKGLRVLAFAEGYDKDLKENMEDYKLDFKFLVGLQDPPKEGVKEAVKECLDAGIRVVMITGDYSKTAKAIGETIGLKFKAGVVTGEEIEKMSDEELREAVNHCDIFSRVIPEHKMRVVKALKDNKEVVAMTGDGVNDAPALKKADIGIAMGKRGTDVAKEAADMILMDDNFTTIVKSVEDGRRIFDNIRKAMVYIMVIHIPFILLALSAPLFNIPQILMPVHIVLMELIIDPTCSIVFELEEAEPNIMRRPPNSYDEPLLRKEHVLKVILQGLALSLATLVPFHLFIDAGINENLARSFALVTLVVGNVILVLVNRSNTEYIFSVKNNISKTRFLVNSIALLMAGVIVYIPFLNPFFKTEPMKASLLIMAILLGIASTIWWEVIKFIKNKQNKRD